MRQAGTQKRAPVQRRGPHAVRRRRSKEQVNQTPEGETEDDVAGILRSRGKWGVSQTTPFYSFSRCYPDGTRVGRGEIAPRQLGLLAEKIPGVPVLILALSPTSSAAAFDLGFCSGLK